MKTISDIRLFRSTVPNTDGNPQPLSIGSRQLNLVLHRIVMKLREQNFSLGEFDHLYLNFTTQLAAGAFPLQPAASTHTTDGTVIMMSEPLLRSISNWILKAALVILLRS